jgi:hypothetical protein
MPDIEVTHDPEIPVRLVQLWLCDPCLDGMGGQCHTPGCALWINRAPDLPLRGNPFVTILTCGQCSGGLVDISGCNCGGGGPDGLPAHEPLCGAEPCPNGCWERLHPEAETNGRDDPDDRHDAR